MFDVPLKRMGNSSRGSKFASKKGENLNKDNNPPISAVLKPPVQQRPVRDEVGHAADRAQKTLAAEMRPNRRQVKGWRPFAADFEASIHTLQLACQAKMKLLKDSPRSTLLRSLRLPLAGRKPRNSVGLPRNSVGPQAMPTLPQTWRPLRALVRSL